MSLTQLRLAVKLVGSSGSDEFCGYENDFQHKDTKDTKLFLILVVLSVVKFLLVFPVAMDFNFEAIALQLVLEGVAQSPVGAYAIHRLHDRQRFL